MTIATNQMDDISLQIAWNRLRSICDEGATALKRASTSVIIGDVSDFSVALTNLDGDTLAASRDGVSLFTGSVEVTAKEMLKWFPLDEMRPGDTFICNDPWIASGHLPDVFLCSPIFHDGRVVGLAASIGHVTDIGGSLKKLGTTEVFEEGLRIPPMRFLRGGEENEDLVALLRYNTRVPDMVLSDFYAQIGAHEIMQRRVTELLTTLGHADLSDLSERILARSERAMRKVIAGLSPGRYEYEEMTDGLIDPALIRIALTVDGDQLTLDYTGSAPESTGGSNNAPYSCTYSEAISMVHTILCPHVPINSGCFRPVTVTVPEGTMFNARRNRAVNARTKPVFRADAVILGVFAQVAPEQVMGSPGLAGHYQVNGQVGDEPFVTYMMLAGGMGGSKHGPGQSCLWFPGTVAGSSAEVLEESAPLLLESRRIRRRSGGSGSSEGGCGEELVLRLKPGFEQPASMSTHPSMLEYPGGGVLGGDPGSVGEMWHNGRQLSRVELNGQGGSVPLGPGDEILIRTPGGGGYGSG